MFTYTGEPPLCGGNGGNGGKGGKGGTGLIEVPSPRASFQKGLWSHSFLHKNLILSHLISCRYCISYYHIENSVP